MSKKADTFWRFDFVVTKALLILGLLPIKEPGIFYRILPFFHVTSLTIFTCAVLNFCRQYLVVNLEYFLKAFGLALSYVTAAQKMLSLICYRKRVIDLHKELSVTFNEDYQISELRSIILAPISMYYRFSLVQWAFIVIATIIYTLRPFFLIIMQLIHGVDTIKYSLPFPAIFPWKSLGSPWRFWPHYIFQVYMGSCLSTTCVAIDTAFGYFIFQISGQLRILSHRMENLTGKDDHWKVVSECVNRYRILMKCRDHLEHIYGPIALWLTVSSSVVLCTLMYQAAHLSPKQLAGVAFYIFVKSLQVFSYGFFGTILMTENDTFREAIYASGWAGSGEKSFMTNVLTMLICNKSFLLNACSVSTISVEMFVAVMNTSMSYYLMIRTIEEGKS